MRPMLGLAILIAGIVVLVFGINAHNSLSSSVSKAVTGAPTDKSIILIAVGIVAIGAGGVVLLRGRGP